MISERAWSHLGRRLLASLVNLTFCLTKYRYRYVAFSLGCFLKRFPKKSLNYLKKSAEQVRTIEKCTSNKLNLLARLFRSAGCRDKEIAHLYDTDINPQTKEIMIRVKCCTDCKKCRSRGGWWKPKTKAGHAISLSAIQSWTNCWHWDKDFLSRTRTARLTGTSCASCKKQRRIAVCPKSSCIVSGTRR